MKKNEGEKLKSVVFNYYQNPIWASYEALGYLGYIYTCISHIWIADFQKLEYYKIHCILKESRTRFNPLF